MKKVQIKKAFQAGYLKKDMYEFSTYWTCLEIAQKLEKARPATIDQFLRELGIDNWYCDLSTNDKKDKIYFYIEDIICEIENEIYANTKIVVGDFY